MTHTYDTHILSVLYLASGVGLVLMMSVCVSPLVCVCVCVCHHLQDRIQIEYVDIIQIENIYTYDVCVIC